jgi:hypothetical protein
VKYLKFLAGLQFGRVHHLEGISFAVKAGIFSDAGAAPGAAFAEALIGLNLG